MPDPVYGDSDFAYDDGGEYARCLHESGKCGGSEGWCWYCKKDKEDKEAKRESG